MNLLIPNQLASFFLALVLLVTLSSSSIISAATLRVGFYSRSCPAAESIILSTVKRAVAADQAAAAKLLRLAFHDCFVEGCDGSILLNINDTSGERTARAHAGVAGFEIIDGAKTQLEAACPGVVSCADILAVAARDAVALSSGPSYELPTGRRDGRVSNPALASNMPAVDDSIEVLIDKFQQKGLSPRDLVLLSAGAHTIGTAVCLVMRKRLYNFTGKSDSDPAINSGFLPQLKSACPLGGSGFKKLPLDWSSDFTFDDHSLRNIVNGSAVLASDARLADDPDTRRALLSYINVRRGRTSTTSSSFGADFAAAMVKLGAVGVKTGRAGEVRRKCSRVN